MQIQPVKYLNNIIEQDHRFIKKVTKPCLGETLRTSSKTSSEIEAMHILWKGQLRRCFSAGLSRAQIAYKIFEFAV